MIRFIDFGKQIAVDESDPEFPRQFAFYNTVSDQFLSANGGQVFDSWHEFEKNATGELSREMISRCFGLCPDWVFGMPLKKGDRS